MNLNVLFDTSILIAAFIESHPKHKEALKFLTRAKENEFELFVSAHTVLEVYSILTSAPFMPKITTLTAKRLIENNIKAIAKIIYLTDKDYFTIFEKMGDADLKGGIVYDAIIVECAISSRIEKIITLNSKDFLRLVGNNIIKIETV